MKGKTFWVILLAFLAGGGVLAWQAWQTWLAAFRRGSLLETGGSSRSRWT